MEESLKTQGFVSSSLLVLFAFALAACSGGGGGGGGGGRVVPRDYDKIACRNNAPDSGPNALFQNKNRTEFVLGVFDKPYDRFDLEAVLDASAVSTTDYVRSLGVTLFRVPRVNLAGACQTYFNLDEAPTDLRVVWDRASGGISDGRLAGLYWDNCQGRCQDFEIVSPTILVDEASDRWTLVHELMHHNFNQGRKANRNIIPYTPLVRQMQRSLQRVEKLMRDHGDRPELATLESIVAETESLQRSLYELEVRGSFEEVALEAQLIREWAANRFKGGGVPAAQSSLWYMDASRKNGLATFQEVRTILNYVRKEAVKNAWTEPAGIARVERAIADVEANTLKVLEDARKLVEAKNGGKGLRPFLKLDPALLAHLEAHLLERESGPALRDFRAEMQRLRGEVPGL